MRRITGLRVSLAIAALALLGGTLSAGELNSPSPATAAELVNAALRTELDGPSPRRQELLRQAISRDPNFAPARWQSGFVRWDDQWRTLDEVAKLAGSDKQMAEYRQRRDALIDTAENQRELARWCKKHKLLDEERIHWSKVLAYDSNDAEALAALGVQWVDGRLLTRRQMDEEKKLRAARMQALYRWRPKLVKWRSAIVEGNPGQRVEAIAALDQLADPEAIDALELVFADDSADNPRSTQLNLLVVGVLARMPQKESTDALLRHAVYSKSQELALAAADALKARPMYVYVPQLIATVPSPLKSAFRVAVTANGTVIHQHELRLEGPEGEYTMLYESMVHPTDVAMATQVTPRAVAREQAKAGAIEAAVADNQQTSDALSKRIRLVLKRTTGFEDVEDQRLWVQQYSEYYGWGVPEKSYKQFSHAAWEREVYFPPPLAERQEKRPESVPAPAPEPPPQRGFVRVFPIPTLADIGLRRVLTSCFAAGTPVMTVLGPRPIESIKPGDRVLSQNVDTGELAYKTVQDCTLRRSVKNIKLTASDESLVTTPGHVFFVVGSGWRVAKHLKVGDRLCGLGPANLVENLEEQPRSEVYNLVVSDFHTFFVGNSRLLVRDDMAPEGTTARVPGLLAGVKP